MLFNVPSRKLKRPVPNRYSRSYNEAKESYPFDAHNGYAIFAYKGVVIEKQNGLYKVGRQIKIKGFPELTLMQLSGSFTSGEIMKGYIDYALEHVNAERHTAVREQYRNWKCPKCGTHALYDPKAVRKIYRYIKNEWGEEEEQDTGRRKVECFFCYHNTPTTEVEYMTDEVML